MNGVVKFYKTDKGFGFITADNGTEIFFHKSGMNVSKLKEGDRVSFDTEQGKKGLTAININKE